MMAENIPFKARAGKKLLKICMGDIYPDPMVVYREYVQNSCDSLQEAEKRGFFDHGVKKTVSINIHSDSITIHDRGIGVGKEDVITSLIDLSFSQKNGQNIGRYGIGRLTGAKYCDKLVFETSANGEAIKSTVTFDAKRAWEIIESEADLECTEVVNMVTELKQEEENPEMHYFRVTMSNVHERHLLNAEEAKQYLSETVPVDFTPQFKDYLLTPAFEEYAEFKSLYGQVPCCNVMVNGEPIKKQYGQAITNSNNQEERVGKLRFFKLENDGILLAWGWYAMTVTAKQFTNNVPFRKIRLRQLNMAVGDLTYFDNLYKKDADALYFMGEIHVVHPRIEPTTGREGLVDNEYKMLFEHKVKELFERLNKEYNELSKFGSQVLDPLTTNMRLLKMENKQVETGLKSIDDAKENKAKYAKESSEAKEKLANELTKIKKNNRIVDFIPGIVEHYQKVSDGEIEKFNKQKDIQKANAQIKKFTLSNEIQKIMGEKEAEKTTVKPNDNTASPSNVSDSDIPDAGCGATEDTPIQPHSEFDAYKGLTQLERNLIKKVYKILDGQKDLPPSIREKLKTKMAKRLTKK